MCHAVISPSLSIHLNTKIVDQKVPNHLNTKMIFSKTSLKNSSSIMTYSEPTTSTVTYDDAILNAAVGHDVAQFALRTRMRLHTDPRISPYQRVLMGRMVAMCDKVASIRNYRASAYDDGEITRQSSTTTQSKQKCDCQLCLSGEAALPSRQLSVDYSRPEEPSTPDNYSAQHNSVPFATITPQQRQPQQRQPQQRQPQQCHESPSMRHEHHTPGQRIVPIVFPPSSMMNRELSFGVSAALDGPRTPPSPPMRRQLSFSFD